MTEEILQALREKFAAGKLAPSNYTMKGIRFCLEDIDAVLRELGFLAEQPMVPHAMKQYPIAPNEKTSTPSTRARSAPSTKKTKTKSRLKPGRAPRPIEPFFEIIDGKPDVLNWEVRKRDKHLIDGYKELTGHTLGEERLNDWIREYKRRPKS